MRWRCAAQLTRDRNISAVFEGDPGKPARQTIARAADSTVPYCRRCGVEADGWMPGPSLSRRRGVVRNSPTFTARGCGGDAHAASLEVWKVSNSARGVRQRPVRPGRHPQDRQVLTRRPSMTAIRRVSVRQGGGHATSGCVGSAGRISCRSPSRTARRSVGWPPLVARTGPRRVRSSKGHLDDGSTSDLAALNPGGQAPRPSGAGDAGPRLETWSPDGPASAVPSGPLRGSVKKSRRPEARRSRCGRSRERKRHWRVGQPLDNLVEAR